MPFTFDEPPPPVPPADQRRFDANGKPTPIQVNYDVQFQAWLKRFLAAITAQMP